MSDTQRAAEILVCDGCGEDGTRAEVMREDDETLYDLEQKHGNLPQTPEAKTGSGGRHVCFALPPDFEVRNIQTPKDGAPPLGAGLDLRGEGGLIVAAGSRHTSGRCYEWDL